MGKKKIKQEILYQFECQSCKIIIDKWLTIDEKRPKRCPNCNKNKLVQLYTTMGHCNFIEASNMTVGKASEINAKRLGKDQIKQMESSDPLKKHQEEQKWKPWWRKGKIPGLESMDKPLDITKIKDINKYVETGEK